MPNRIEINFKEEDYDKVIKISTEVVAIVNTYVPELPDNSNKGGQNMGEGTGWAFAQKAFELITADRSLVHVDLLDYDAFARNIAAVTKLIAIKAILGGWIGNMNSAFIAIGKDLMVQSNAVLTALEPLSKNKKAYKILYDDLNSLYKERAVKAATTIQQNKVVAELSKELNELKEAAKKA